MVSKAEVWLSSEKDPGQFSWFDGPKPILYRNSQQPDLVLTAPETEALTTISVYPDIVYQEILGFGTSMEETTVFNMSKMSRTKKEELYKALLDKKDGAGFDFIRITLGTSDFTARTFYSYNDLEQGESDFELEKFSIQKDIDFGIVDTIQNMLKLSPDLKIFASSWSPPAWMKTTESLQKGELKEGKAFTDVLAKYYRKSIQAYKEQGIPIYAITLQNEPLLEIEYPSCFMSPERQRELVVATRKELDEHGLDTKIWIFDHNFYESWMYVPPILNDAEGYAATAGIAFHDYNGQPTCMTEIKSAYPEKTMHMTERTVWGTYGADRIAQYFRNWASSYNAWVTMLDSRIGTHQWVDTPGATMIIQDASDTEQYWMTPEYYLLGQFSKFIQHGARRVESNYGSTDTVTNVAFYNPDHTLVVVAINQTDNEQKFRILCDGKQITANIPAKTVATYRWKR
ncbi:glucosylceramidase [Paenibacillus castaneae]|uniref:glycoside hydrolase family 30 protein n=1 Tax=Paenibacillus castaneae TaxID=474957 RepID=UPI000C9D2285|nr:glycoside hydrolase family 30 beta sandwich domain-containing protein [Paenibacillus castaneae]NIK77761.1 glucosylceramidase [Paenibacillus castaneae]